MKYRNDKVAVSIQKYVSDIIQFKVKNKDLGICSVTHCEVTNDYSLARLYIIPWHVVAEKEKPSELIFSIGVACLRRYLKVSDGFFYIF